MACANYTCYNLRMHRVVPQLIVENFRAGQYGGEFRAVGMFLDLSGFSKMTDALMQHGQHGAEVLAGLMHSVFDPLVESIFEYGGRIISFAGDGIMALYPVEHDERATALRALGSAWAIQQALSENPDRHTVYGGFSFSIKIGLAVGSVTWRILRSPRENQATYYFRGVAVNEAAEAEHHAGAGEIVLNRRINEILDDALRTRPSGAFHLFVGFENELPEPIPYDLPDVDVEAARHFMPEDVIVHDMRGEFRQIVNLFVRIPELTDEKLEGFINAVFELRNQYGGLLTRIDFGDKGCNLLLLWGAPVAYENDIGRALNFILDLQARADFPITAGLTYYIAHAGYLGSEMCEDYTCYGWGVNLASRFMMSAPVGRIWVDERVTRRVSQSFEIEHIGSQPFKGFAAEQRVYVLLGRKPDVDALYQGEMVGRQEELNTLARFVEPIWQGRFAGVIGVAGDAGIGKGRLVHAFQTSAVFKEHKALWAVCQTDQILRQSFNPVRKWLHRYFGFAPGQTFDERKSAFDAKLDELLESLPDPELSRELNRTRSILGALVDLTWDASLYDQLDAEGRYNNTFLALIALVKAESLRQPLVLFMDDIHFMDPDSNEFLSQLKRSLSASSNSYPVAIILAYRKQGMELNLSGDLIDGEIELKGISPAELYRLAEILLGGPASPDLLNLTMSRSEGNPYFAEQIIRYLREEDQLEMSSDGWRQARRGRSSVLPQDISALLIARLDQLAQNVKAVVQTASVLGREFEVRVLAQMLGPATDTGHYVSEAEKAAIWLPLQEMRYVFYHALLRDAAYSMQMRVRRKELHALALRVLEKIYESDQEKHYAEFAFHAENGDIRVKARHYYTLAGRVSAGLYQNNQAADYFSRAIAYTLFDDLATRFDLVVERVELYARMAKRDLQLKDLEVLEQMAGQMKEHDRLMKVMMLRSVYHYFTGDYQGAVEYAKSAEGAPASLAESTMGLYAQIVRTTALLRLGHVDEAMQRARSLLARVRILKNRNEECRILNVMGLIAMEQKESSPAKEYFAEGLEIAREVKNRDVEAKVLNNLAMAEGLLNANHALAREYYEQSYLLSQEIGDRHGVGHSLANLGYSAGMQGDFSAARSYHEQALKIVREDGDLYGELNTLINLSALEGMYNEVEPALQNAKQAVRLAQKASDPSGEAWAMLYLGHAHMLRNEIEPAQAAYRNSIDIRTKLGQTSLLMEPLAGLVQTYMQADDLEAAADPAGKILNLLESGAALDGSDEPLRVYYTCYRYLERKRDPRSGRILQQAKKLLETQVSKFGDEADRQRYVENIPWRRAIWHAPQSKQIID